MENNQLPNTAVAANETVAPPEPTILTSVSVSEPVVAPAVAPATASTFNSPTTGSSLSMSGPKGFRKFSIGSTAFGLTLGITGLAVAFCILTFGVELNIWAQIGILLVVSLAALFASLKAYDNSKSGLSVVSLVIATLLACSTLVYGGTSLYYYYKFKALSEGFSNSSYEFNYSTSSDSGDFNFGN